MARTSIVADKPEVTLRLGSPFRDGRIHEGSDVYFECVVNANPPAAEVHWSKDGVTNFATKTTNGSTITDVVISGRFLALQKARRNFSGQYACTATNSEGSATSNSIRLRVQRKWPRTVFGVSNAHLITDKGTANSQSPPKRMVNKNIAAFISTSAL